MHRRNPTYGLVGAPVAPAGGEFQIEETRAGLTDDDNVPLLVRSHGEGANGFCSWRRRGERERRAMRRRMSLRRRPGGCDELIRQKWDVAGAFFLMAPRRDGRQQHASRRREMKGWVAIAAECSESRCRPDAKSHAAEGGEEDDVGELG